MVVKVYENYHDYETKVKYVDTDLLTNIYEDQELLKAINAKKDFCKIDASNWEENPLFGGCEPGISQKSQIKKPKNFDYSITLNIDFDC